jgi:hypothetical protein
LLIGKPQLMVIVGSSLTGPVTAAPEKHYRYDCDESEAYDK